MQKSLIILVLFMSCYSGLAQSDWAKVQDQNVLELRRGLRETIPTPSLSQRMRSLNTLWIGNRQALAASRNLAAAPVPSAWNYQDLAFFCKLEVKMEKAFQFPVKVRLGEVQMVERMEGKLKTHFLDQSTIPFQDTHFK